jgi:hypothetical protein
MNRASKLFLIFLSAATIMPMAANPSQKKSDEATEEKATLSQDEISKLHWVGLLTGLWLTKASAVKTYQGFVATLMPEQIVALTKPDAPAAEKALLAKGVMGFGIVSVLLGIPATYLSAKLTWFFAKKKLKGNKADLSPKN